MLNQNQVDILLQQLKDAIVVINRQGTVTYTNHQLHPLLGVKLQLDTPLTDQDIAFSQFGFADDAIPTLVDDIANQLVNTNEPHIFEIDVPYQRVISRTILEVQDSIGQLESLILLFRDDTPAQQFQENQNNLASMIVHDLRSPLTAITSGLRLLRDLAEPDDSFGQVVLQTTEISGRAVRKLLNLVSSILDVTKMENGHYNLSVEYAPLKPIIINIMDELTPLATELEVTLDHAQVDQQLQVDVDVEKIDRVFYNLIDNAIKFSPSNSAVRVTATVEDDSKMVLVQVIDHGKGIPDEQKVLVFDRYFQMTNQRRGTGLGLTYCKLTVEAHGGSIWIEDNPKGGTIFSFRLPVATD